MPDPLQTIGILSALVAVPALAVAIYHGLRMEKTLHKCSREHPCEKGRHRR